MRLLPMLMLMLVAACGSEDPSADGGDGDADATPVGDRYLPLVVGAKWTYRVTDTKTGDVEDKANTVEALEAAPGHADLMAFRVRTEKLDGATLSWQVVEDGRVERLREENYDLHGFKLREETYSPSKLRLDETGPRLVAGATWTETFTEYGTDFPLNTPTTLQKRMTWTVEAVGEAIEAGGQSYSTVRLRKSGEEGQADKTYWFARGVGKVREEGKGQHEELLSASQP